MNLRRASHGCRFPPASHCCDDRRHERAPSSYSLEGDRTATEVNIVTSQQRPHNVQNPQSARERAPLFVIESIARVAIQIRCAHSNTADSGGNSAKFAADGMQAVWHADCYLWGTALGLSLFCIHDGAKPCGTLFGRFSLGMVFPAVFRILSVAEMWRPRLSPRFRCWRIAK